MTDVDTFIRFLCLPGYDTSNSKLLNGDVMLHLYAKDKNDVQPTYEKLKAIAEDLMFYLTTAMPANGITANRMTGITASGYHSYFAPAKGFQSQQQKNNTWQTWFRSCILKICMPPSMHGGRSLNNIKKLALLKM
jgi:hypothetical protein